MYSDKASIANITYFVQLSKDVPDPNAPFGITSAILGLYDGFYFFADGTKYDVRDIVWTSAGISPEGIVWHSDHPLLDEGYFVRSNSAHMSADISEQSAQALTHLRDATTLHVDVIRVLTIAYQHPATANSARSSITTLTDSKVLCNIELTKTDFGFASGPVPDFMYDGPYNVFGYVLPPGTPKPQQPPLLSLGKLFNEIVVVK